MSKYTDEILAYEYLTDIQTGEGHMFGVIGNSSKYKGEYAQIEPADCYYSNKPYSKEYLDMLYMLGLCEVL